MIQSQPLNVRAWYGLPAEIAVGRMWHWVDAGLTMDDKATISWIRRHR